LKVSDGRPLPRCKLSLTQLGLGGAPMGGLYRTTTPAEATALFEAAWAGGIRYFDTAPYYGYTRAERRLGSLLCECDRESYVISTKAGRLMVPDPSIGADENGWINPLPFRPTYDYTYDAILRSFEDSQQRLGIIKINLLLIHDIGRYTHGEQHNHYWAQLTKGGGFRAFSELRNSGRVEAVGLGVNEWEVVHDAMQEFDLDVTMLAGRYTLLEQTSLPLLDECVRLKNAIVIAGPFNSGILAGSNKFNYTDAPAEISARAQALKSLCAEFGVSLPAAALQFPMAHAAVVSCVTGAQNAHEVQANIASFETPIPAEFWQMLAARGLVDEGAPLPKGDA
jgi:D-threo-aldose 1-dehydrogenase